MEAKAIMQTAQAVPQSKQPMQSIQTLMEMPGNQLTNPVDAERLIHDAKVIGECYRVRVLFDTEHLKADKDYIAIVEDTWLRTFKDTDPELLETAVQEFIVSDKKGYLPKPGQIVELLVKGIKRIESRRYYAEIERRHREKWLAEMEEDKRNNPEKWERLERRWNKSNQDNSDGPDNSESSESPDSFGSPDNPNSLNNQDD